MPKETRKDFAAVAPLCGQFLARLKIPDESVLVRVTKKPEEYAEAYETIWLIWSGDVAGSFRSRGRQVAPR